MKAFWSASIIVALSAFTTLAAAEDFDGTKPMSCTPQKGHDCLPTANSCNRLKRESKDSIDFGIDVAKKEVKSPFRTTTLPIETIDNNEQSLVLQGTDLQFAWSMVIHRAKGTMTLTVADRKGAYVVFGQCRLADAPPAP